MGAGRMGARKGAIADDTGDLTAATRVVPEHDRAR